MLEFIVYFSEYFKKVLWKKEWETHKELNNDKNTLIYYCIVEASITKKSNERLTRQYVGTARKLD